MARAGRTRAYVGLGANVGDAAGTVAARSCRSRPCRACALAGVSRLYATAPVGVTDQPEFRNAVVALDVPSGPDPATGALALLVALKGLERAFGRRHRRRWGPRELDLDLLVFGRARLAVDRPPEARSARSGRRAGEGGQAARGASPGGQGSAVRAGPLADLAPGLVPPGWGETVATARARRELAEGADAARPIARWDRPARAFVSDLAGGPAKGRSA